MRRAPPNDPIISGTNSTSEDLYILGYAFTNVSTGHDARDRHRERHGRVRRRTSVGTSATASDAAVTTLGPDRLALNFVAVDDDNDIDAVHRHDAAGHGRHAGVYYESTGTDGSIQLLQTRRDGVRRAPSTAGPACITDSDNWGVVGFALIGTTPSGRQPRGGVVMFQDPGIF